MFYGSSLPRPQVYIDFQFNSDRVNSLVLLKDPFFSWARWSMGGLSFQRLCLQGRVEGNVKKRRQEIAQLRIKRTIMEKSWMRRVKKEEEEEKEDEEEEEEEIM
ncbi:hypothetical protein RCOM_0131110 [Ricinus communis]|uniref:Uncharacterized protein n=1 Tax=Ricinus communis TaxID=3988 RepID=B9SVF2_RICCO|nr:hypothetical protein RCOM_0131110 [Ricinus communis]